MDAAADFKNKGNDAFRNGEFDKAVEWFTKAIEVNPNDHVLYSNRSGAYCSLNKFDEALDDANKCIQINPQFIKGYSRKGLAQEGLGFIEEAMQTYDQGLTYDPSSELLTERKLECEAKLGGGGGQGFPGGMPSADMQQKLLMQLLSNPATASLFQDPAFLQKFQDVQTNPANIMKYMNDPQFMQVMSVLSGNFGGMGGARGPAPGQNFGGFQPSQPGQPKETHSSNKMNEEPIPPKREEPKKEESKKSLSEAEKEKQLGNDAYKRKDFDVAIQHYQKAIELEPKNLLFRSNLAAVLIEKKDYAKAIEVCEEADKVYKETDYREKKFEDLAKIYARHARVLELQDKLDESIEMYNKSLLESKEYKVEQDLKRVKQIKKERDDNAYLNPELGNQARDRGNKLFSDGKFVEALVEYAEAIKRNPKDYKSYNNRATCYVKLMEFNLAMKEVDKSLEIEPNFGKALVRKGSIHHVLKEYHKAIEVLEKALEIDPKDESAQDQLRKTRMAIASSMNQEGNDEDRLRRAMADPEIQQIMMDPMLKIALQKMQEDPKGAAQYFTDPNLGPKLQKLIQAGILKVA